MCRSEYPFGSVESAEGAEHFTQVVWSDSTELGMGKATTNEFGMQCTYVVARYKPLGNVNTGQDDYNKNVKRGSNLDQDNYCRLIKRKRKQFQTKNFLHGAKVKKGLPEKATHENGETFHVLRKEKHQPKNRKHRF